MGLDRTDLIGVAFTLNYIVGSGVLSLPHAVANAGILLGAGFLLFVYLCSNLTAGFMVEITGRASLLKKTEDSNLNPDQEPLLSDLAINTPLEDEISALADHKFEMNELVLMFLGRVPRYCFDVIIVLFVYGALLLYASIFADTLESVVFPSVTTSNNYHYYIWIPIFACIVTPLSMMNLSGQVAIQLGLTAFALVAMLIMTFTTVGEFYEPNQQQTYSNGTICTVSDTAPYIHHSPVFRFSYFGPLFTTALFSFLCQHGTPSLIEMIKYKTHVKTVFFSAMTLLFTLYASLCVVTTLYYCDVKGVITANWESYGGSGRKGWQTAISYFIQVFPIVTVSTAFPLNVSALGNNLCSMAPHHWKQRLGEKKLYYICRLIAIVPPLVAATFLSSVSNIVQYPGLLGFFVMLIVPSVLQISSRKVLLKRGFSVEVARGPYWNAITSNDIVVGLLLLISVVGLPYATYETISSSL